MPPLSVPAMLTVRDTMMLDFERSWWKFPGAKDEEIVQTFSMTSTRYYQALNALIDRSEVRAVKALQAGASDYCLIQSPHRLVVKN